MFSTYTVKNLYLHDLNPQHTMQEILTTALIKDPQLTTIGRSQWHMQASTHKSLPTGIMTGFVRLRSEQILNVVCELFCPPITSSKQMSTSSASSSSKMCTHVSRYKTNVLHRYKKSKKKTSMLVMHLDWTNPLFTSFISQLQRWRTMWTVYHPLVLST